jgi:hypothetical protein
MLSMQILFKVCNNAFNIGGLWHPIFPHFLIHPRPEILSQSYQSQISADYKQKTLAELVREPTLFYLIQSSGENSEKFRTIVCYSITTLLENSETIARWQG